MHYGLTMFPTDYSIQPAELAREAEARGFESLWFPEHTHIPVERKSPWPGGPELPKMYYDVYEPFVALAAAAAATTRIKLATGICLVVQRDPLQTAKSVATLDRVSNGRFLFGIGAGWNAEEMANHGTAFKTRLSLMRERVLAMKELWTKSKPEFHGKFVEFAPVMTWPKPLQKPHPPIHVGGGFPKAVERAIDYGDGWMPIFGRDEIVERIPEVRERVRAAGRDPEKFEISIFAAPPQADLLARARDAAVTRCVFGLPPAKQEDVLPLLDRYAELARSVG
ncbi:MAG TPA: LLM class F420-dependent oxidoreductase [Myxococcota bacterium]|nr:LLM class F420-dependent oxidoreductase [Myxococcota bacterium]